jgi:autotransporter-associated beta strand protein
VSVNGTQLFTGMQFLTDGYNVVNGASGLLTAVNGTGGTTAMRVDPGVTATVGVNIDGSGILNKLDAGTLVLNGANSYTGGTQLDGGTLVVGSNTALGSGADRQCRHATGQQHRRDPGQRGHAQRQPHPAGQQCPDPQRRHPAPAA